MEEKNLKNETANNTNTVLNTISFVSISSGTFWNFKSWDEIVSKGGLKKLLPKDDWDNIFNEKACEETISQVYGDLIIARITNINKVRICSKNITVDINTALYYIKPFEKAMELFHKRNGI